MQWYLKVLQNYVGFQGRARRSEFWFFMLFNFIIVIVLSILDRMLGLASDMTGYGILTGIYSLAVLLPGLAVEFRRLHDTDRSAWWLLIALIPFVGAIVLLIFFCQSGTPGPNRFGPDPKAG